MRFEKHLTAVAVFFLSICGGAAIAQDAWRKEVEAARERRNASLREDPFSPLALVHREYLDGRKMLTIDDSSLYDLQLPAKISGRLHVFFEDAGILRVQRDPRDPKNLDGLVVNDRRRFSVGRFNLLYRAEAPVRGAALEVYDTEEPALKEFGGLEFFEIDARYRVQAEIVPHAEPPQVQLIDSAGQPRPYYIYGDLRFAIEGVKLTMEVYSTTLDRAAIERGGFMLIFADATSGKESYYAGRYLDIEGKPGGAVAVDFNLARNPPCAFSPVYTCPLPRAQNRLPVAIRAGEKAFRGVTATVRQPAPAQ